MKRNLIYSLSALLRENGSIESIETIEIILINSFDEIGKEESFYKLPANEDVEFLCSAISMMCRNKGLESVLLLNVIDSKEATFDECIKVISEFSHCPICKRTGELFEKENLPTINYKYEIEKLKEEIEKHKETSRFQAVVQKPADLERDICDAAKKGKLTSVQYLIEQCQINALSITKRLHYSLFGACRACCH